MSSPKDGASVPPSYFSDTEASVVLPKQRKTALPALGRGLAYRSSNPSLNTLLASTSSLPNSRPTSPSTTPTLPSVSGSTILSTGTARSSSPLNQVDLGNDDPRVLIRRSFAPYVSVLASSDADELIKQKGFPGGFLELIRPFGETVNGKVTVRDSVGASRSWDDFGIRFVGIKDGFPSSRSQFRRSADAPRRSIDTKAEPFNGLDPPFQKLGGDIGQIEEAVDRHLLYAEYNAGGPNADYSDPRDQPTSKPTAPYHWLYLRRLMSALPMTPHETFSHPVACVIAISSRSPSPIEELRRLYDSTNSGEYRLPLWVNNEFLRYYVLVHDDDHDDFRKSSALYERMTKAFGLHCHLLRVRSAQCVASDDDSLKLPMAGWISAGEELAEIQKRENSDDAEDPTPCLFESDATAIRIFVRELVTQSIIPSMERLSATWNEQVASRRRGIGGRFISLSKRWTGFGSSRTSSGPASLPSSSGSNYDSLQGFYRPDTPEAIMRKLADYAFMLRDFKLAREIYDLVRQDYNNDKAWKYYAGANEMTALSTLLNTQTSSSSKSKLETIEQLLEMASYSYTMRCNAPYYALRALALSVELLKLRGLTAVDDAAKWAGRIIDTGLVGPIGNALFMERISSCYLTRKGIGMLNIGSRQRRAAMWASMSAASWLRLEKIIQAERCLAEAATLYGLTSENPKALEFEGIRALLAEISDAIEVHKRAAGTYDETEEEIAEEPLTEEVSEQLDRKTHRKSIIGVGAVPYSPADVPPLTPALPQAGEEGFRDDNFE